MATIRVLIVDDHELYRRGIESSLSEAPDIEIVAQAADGEEAVSMAIEFHPDVVLMDLRMPRMNGVEACARIKEFDESIKVLVVTVSEAESDLLSAVRAGANGYLLKDIALSEFPEAVRAANRGVALISPTMATIMLAHFTAMIRQQSSPGGLKLAMTRREREVLALLAAGHSNREIATELFIAENTVKNHVRSILDKLGVHSRMEAVVRASKLGLIALS